MEKKRIAVCVDHKPVLVTNTYKRACRAIAKELAEERYAQCLEDEFFFPTQKWLHRRMRCYYSIIELNAEAWIRGGAKGYLDIEKSDDGYHVEKTRFSITVVD